MSMPPVDRMFWEENLRALEELWAAITREGNRHESPAWQEQELKETQQRYDGGAEESMDWTTAKRKLGR
jgi:hypothetical protein